MVITCRRMACILLAMALILIYMPTGLPIAEADAAAEAGNYGYGLLETAYEKTAYEKISEGIRNLERNIEFKFVISDYDDAKKDQYVQQIQKAAEKALRLVMADHPEYFWFDGDGGLSIYHSKGDEFTVYFQTHAYSVDGKTVTKSNIGPYIQQLERAAAEALRNMPTDRDLAKIHYLHDYLAETIEYEFGEDDQTTYGALVEKKAVCAGYSRAYQYLLNKAGVKCWYVTGQSTNPVTMGRVNHAWNIVWLDGKCYYTDITWDDQASDVFHAYYMLSRAECDTSHYPDHPEDLPSSCGHKDLDYFEVHKGDGTGIGMLTGSYNPNQLAACMKKVGDDTWVCHVEDLTGGGPHVFISWMSNRENVNAVAAALGIVGGYQWSFSSLWDEYQIEFKSLPDVHQHDRVLIGMPYKAPTCTENGNQGYFVCRSCGAWFKDWSGQEEILDHDSIKIPALDHTYSKTESNDDQHWKSCKDCGLEKMDSRADHFDHNKDGKCDVCGAAVEIPTEPPAQSTEQPTTGATEEPSVEPSTDASSEPTEGETSEPTGELGSEPSEGATEPTGWPTEPTVWPTEPSGSVNPSVPTDGSQPVQSKPSGSEEQVEGGQSPDMLPVLIIGGVAAVVAITVVVLLAKKKK